jgi:hypothetical protein
MKDGLSHQIIAFAKDPEGNVGVSEQVNFVIAETEDIIDPTVAIVNPQNNQTVEGTVRVAAEAKDERSIQKVAFFVDGDSMGVDSSYPYTYDWNTIPFADSTEHTLFAKAFDSGNNTAISDVVTVTVYPHTSKDIIPPTVSILYPISGSTVSGTINVVADIQDNGTIAKAEFYIDGELVGEKTEAEWEYSWNTASKADSRTHSVYVKAYDSAGNVGKSSIVAVTVEP